MTDLIYNGPNYRVSRAWVHDSALVVVTFDFRRGAVQGLDGESFGERFLARQGINGVFVRTARDDWYQHEDMVGVLAAIRQATAGCAVITYGGSMGGYAAINFAADLGATRAIALAPQYSIDALKPGADPAYHTDAASITFRHDHIDRPPRIGGYILFDPRSSDSGQTRLILKHHDLVPIPVMFCEHQPGHVLQEARMFEWLIVSLIDGSYEPRSARTRLRSHRRRSAAYWLGVSHALHARGWVAQSIRAARAGLAAENGPRFAIAGHLARMLAEVGDMMEAREILDGFLDDPSHGGDAQWQIDALRKRET